MAVLSYFRDRHLTRLIVAARRANLPADTPVYYGGYWGSDLHPVKPPPPPGPGPPSGPKRPRPTMPGRRFAPIFSLVPTEFWRKRHDLSGDERRILRGTSQRGRRGRIPGPKRLMRLGGAARYQWGLELGRRWRDRIRHKRAGGLRVTSWQLDELPNELVGRGGYKRRQFIQGALMGVAFGRAPLGDGRVPGIVYATGKALTLARRPAHGGLRRFWRALNACTLYLVGEEYPAFVGSAHAAARRHRAYRSWLWHSGGARRALARRYVVGMTPGYRIVPGLGGNVRHRGRPHVRAWRRAYVRSRAHAGVTGFAEYNFVDRNASFAVMNDVLGAISLGLRIAGRG